VLVPVQVRLAVNAATGKIDRAAPMMVWSDTPIIVPASMNRTLKF